MLLTSATLLPTGRQRRRPECKNLPMTAVPEDFVQGLEGVVAFTTEIAEPDKDGGALRYRGVDIEDLVNRQVTFGDVWALLVDGRFGHSLPPAEPFPLPIHSGDVRVDVQAGLAMLAPIWGYPPLLDIDDQTARDQLARASVMALSYVAQSARGIYQPAVPQRTIDQCSTVTERFMTRWQGDPAFGEVPSPDGEVLEHLDRLPHHQRRILHDVRIGFGIARRRDEIAPAEIPVHGAQIGRAHV